MDIQKRIDGLRKIMKDRQIDYYYVTTSDYHNSEYVDDHFKEREFLSGFTGSCGNLLIGEDFAGLWTDGRYFIQAGKELAGSGILLFCIGEEGVPTILEYLEKNMNQGQTLAFDGRCISFQTGNRLEQLVLRKQGRLLYEEDLVDELWQNRPPRTARPVFSLPKEICGKSIVEKLAQVRAATREAGGENLILSKLDDIMWLFNLRGSDVECNPVALSYSVITQKECFLFLQKAVLDEETEGQLAAQFVLLKEYDDFMTFLEGMNWKGKVLLDKLNSNFSILKLVERKAQVLLATNPTELLKARKNGVELEQLRQVYLRDSLAVCRFMHWLKENIGRIPMTEVSAAGYMDGLRKNTEGFLELSFPTICGFRENAAMMHYQATKEEHKRLEPEGMLLIDSGGQYMGGTTDVTRTYALGAVTAEMKTHYTAVVMGMLRLLNSKFLYGCTGRNLDILARGPLWDRGIDYKCGTGHGIGYMLNVHEGPQNIRWRYTEEMPEAVLEEGMLLSNEPGVYKAGSHGIRIENIMVVKKGVKNEDGQFMEFEGLTYAPLDLDLIDVTIMEKRDIDYLNGYHQEVYEKIAPLMDENEALWLKKVTRRVEQQV